MFGWFGRLRFRVQIFLFMFAIVLISLGVSALIVFPQARRTQHEIKLDRLLSTGKLKQTWVERHFESTRNRVRIAAHTDLTIIALAQFDTAVRRIEQDGPQAIDLLRRKYASATATSAPATTDTATQPAIGTAPYDAVADVFDPLLSELAEALELDDLLLVRVSDQLVVYSARKGPEFLRTLSEVDAAANLRRCAARVLAAPGERRAATLAFEDFEVRQGSTGPALACLGAPLFGKEQPAGVLLALIPITPLNGIMLEQREASGEIGTCLVGTDFRLRSGAPLARDALTPHWDRHIGVREAHAGGSGHGVAVAPDGSRSLAVWFPVRVADDTGNWALIAEMDEAEVYAAVNRNTRYLSIWWSVMLVLLMAMAFAFSRRVDRAVRALMKRTRAVAAGSDPAPLARSESSREFTELVDSFNDMTTRIRDRAISAERAQRAAVEEREALLRASEQRLLRQNSALVKLAQVEPQHGPHEGECVRDVTETAGRTLDASRCSVWFFDEAGTRLHCMQLHDRDRGCFECGMELEVSEYPSYFAALQRDRVVAAHDAWSDPRTRELADGYLRPMGITSLLDAAIHAGGRTVGVVCFEHVGPPRTWQIDEQNFASALADLVALLKESMERDKAEAALLESRERLALTFAATNDAIFDVNLVTDRLVVNPRFFELCDLPPGELDRRAWRERIHPEDRARVEAALNAHTRGETPALDVEYRQRARGGEYVWVQMRAGIVSHDAEGRATRIVGTQRDVTDRRRAQEAEAERAAADESNKAKSQFLANMSHELRTPLNGVLGYAQILQRDPLMGPKQRECLEAIESCGRHLLTLINDVLDFSKIEAGRLELHNEACDLPRLLIDVGHVVRQRAELKGVRFDLEVPPSVPSRIVIDPTKLRQVLVNLLGNAVKFTERGNITLSVRPEAEDRLYFEVRDTGIGIPSDKLTLVFDAFRQTADGAAAGGTGLGLAISRKIVAALGGALEVRSAPGAGSSFFFTLPVTLAATGQLSANEAAAEDDRRIWTLAPDQRIRVLIADDRDANRDILVRLLEAAGFETLQCENGAQAIEITRSRKPNLVFMDVRMPVMNGLEATRALRADPELKNLRIIAVTASVIGDARREVRDAGCDDMIGKPFRAGDVFRKIEQHLNAKFVNPDGRDSATPARSRPHVDAATVREALPPDGAQVLARRLRTAAEIGSITEVNAIAAELASTGGSSALCGEEIARLASAFDFDALAKLADEFENCPNAPAEQ